MPTHEKVACEGMFYYIIYANALHCIFVFILPLSIIIFFNVHLMRSLKVAQRSRKAMTSRSRSDDNNINQCSRKAMTSRSRSDDNNITQCCRKAMTSRSRSDDNNITQCCRKAMTSRSRSDDNNITQCSRTAMTSRSRSDDNNITQCCRTAMTSRSRSDDNNITQCSRKAMTSRSRSDDNNITQCSRMAMTSLLSSDENNITVVMIVIIIVFVVCQAPMIMSIPLIYFNDWTLICSSQVQFYFVSRLLLTVNSSINFVIYCLFRRQFRNQLCMLVGHICCRPSQQHPDRQPNDA